MHPPGCAAPPTPVLPVIIFLLPLGIVLGMVAASEPLRRARWKPILMDVGVTVLCIGAFQVAFYFLGQRWRYAGMGAILDEIAQQYNASAGTTNAMADCGSCSDKLKNVMQRTGGSSVSPCMQSPTVARLQTQLDQPERLMNLTVGQVLQAAGVTVPTKVPQSLQATIKSSMS